MDPVSHLVMGRVVVASLDRGGSRVIGAGAVAASVMGALAPDVDFVLMPMGWDVYLRHHEVGTHSVLGACALGAVVASLVRLFVRDARWRALAWAASLAALSHLALDVLSGARLGLAWPFAPTRVTLPLVAMAEPWLVALFVVVAAGMWLARASPRRAAVCSLLLVVVSLTVKGALFARALSVAGADPRLDRAIVRAIEARSGSWAEWDVFERHADALRVWRVNAVSGAIVPILEWPLTVASPLVGQSASLDTVDNFLSVHDLTFAIERATAAGDVEVLWSDARFCRQASPGTTRPDCSLWMGGVFDPQGRALRQVVHLGAWSQIRPLSR